VNISFTVTIRHDGLWCFFFFFINGYSFMMEAGANFNALHYFLPILIRLFFLVKGVFIFQLEYSLSLHIFACLLPWSVSYLDGWMGLMVTTAQYGCI